MATKKATYQYDNGTGFDEIMFKTTADQVILKDGKSVQDFFNNGGELFGNLIMRGNWKSVQFKRDDNKSHFIQSNPSNNGLFVTSDLAGNLRDEFKLGLEEFLGLGQNKDLGNPNYPWKNVYLSGVSINPSGYTRLTNGLILQWGKVNVYFGGGNNGYIYGLLPISFSTTILSHQGICSGNGFNWGNSDLIVGVGSIDNRGVTWTVNTRNGASVTGNAEISYMVLGY